MMATMAFNELTSLMSFFSHKNSWVGVSNTIPTGSDTIPTDWLRLTFF